MNREEGGRGNHKSSYRLARNTLVVTTDLITKTVNPERSFYNILLKGKFEIKLNSLEEKNSWMTKL